MQPKSLCSIRGTFVCVPTMNVNSKITMVTTPVIIIRLFPVAILETKKSNRRRQMLLTNKLVRNQVAPNKGSGIAKVMTALAALRHNGRL